MAGPILDNTTINQPVANPVALAAIPTASLVAGCIVLVIADTNGLPSIYRWSGSAWVLVVSNLDMLPLKAVPLLADEIMLWDSAANAYKKTTLTAIQTTLAATSSTVVATTPGTLNVALGVPVPLYTVPAGFTFQVTQILIRGKTALVGAGAQFTVGTTVGSNIDILGATTITPTLVVGQGMPPIAPIASNTIVGAGGVINGVVSTTETSGTVTIQLIGVLNPA